MIGLYCNDSDISFNDVSKWLTFFNIDFIRSENISLLLNDCEQIIARKSIKLTEDKILLSNGDFNRLSKLHVLEQAKKAELTIPKTYVFKNLDDLRYEIKQGDDTHFVIKPINEITRTYKDGVKHVDYTTLFTFEEIIDFDFDPQVYAVQSYIEPLFEIRAFVLLNAIYSTAVFRLKELSSDIVDIRYDYANQNVVYEPIRLPDHVHDKILNLFRTLELSYGAVDLIFNKKTNEYVFLEINPMGQFKGPADHCNYEIAKHIAQLYFEKN